MSKVRKFMYYGYALYTNGTIIGIRGTQLKRSERKILSILITDENGNTRRKTVIAARVLYELYYNVKLRRDQSIGYRDDDSSNISIENLYIYKRNSPEDKSFSMRKKLLSQEQTEEILRLYSNADGHCNSQWNKGPNDYTIRDLANKFSVSINTIQNVLRKRDEVRT